ncbi:MAG: S8 family serine peptidase [Planctomycetaceae bacterium]|nr:S8 family serine peptidase [Planctomycetaceae bacterium]
MSHPQPRRLNSLFGTRAPKERRPTGVSRKRKKQLGFESLEARQVMSATPLVAAPTYSTQSYSNDSADGAYQQLLDEMYWQSLIAQATGANAATKSASTRSVPVDPLINNQWHLVNSGQQVGSPDFQPIYGTPGEDINLGPVWNSPYTGAGVKVGVIDSGIQLTHPDLAANILTALGFDALSTSGTGTGNPNVAFAGNAHGTAVAGLIGAVANNGIGGAGVAAGVSLVPIRLVDEVQPLTPTDVIESFRYAIQADLDITNNSWGPPDTRTLAGPTPAELLALRDSVWFGRPVGDGTYLGIINVWAAGNGGAHNSARPGFPGDGFFDSSNYDGYANSRYVIAVTGVDHDGSYNNIDGTVTAYPESGANVLVAAPTGSVFLRLGNDTGIGSGLWTTDLIGDDGFNESPDPITGEEVDRDYLANTDYTSRFNGTSASAPIVTGVIALMLEANPNLNWRDVKEILIRAARQNDQFGVPSNGAGATTQNTWITNQVPIFHDPDRYDPGVPIDPALRLLAPVLNPNAVLVGNERADGGVFSDHYAGDPFRMTNGAGYTVSQGSGVYGEQVGYAHGVIDADMAIKLAEQWTVKNQALPNQEHSFTTYLVPEGNISPVIPAAEVTSPPDGIAPQVVPGGIGGANGFISLWNEYYADDPDFGQTFPARGGPIEFSVPASNTMSIESVDVRLSIGGSSSEAMEHLRIMLVSPEGTYSELNNYWVDLLPAPDAVYQWEGLTAAHPILGSMGSNGGAEFVWTFNTNRSWGERSDDAITYDPVTGEPVIDDLGFFGADPVAGGVLKQGWRLVIENWDNNDSFTLQGVELAWHGSKIGANTQRLQGAIGVDNNRDDQFNFSRVIQTIGDFDGDSSTFRLGEVVSQVDLTQEAFAGNVTVNVRRASDNVLVDQFVTGHDGNFYFDLVPDDYIVSIDDPLGRVAQEDGLTPAGRLQDYKTEWTITKDYFKVWDKVPGSPSETIVDANGVPVAWLDGNGDETVTGMKGINFLLDPGDPQVAQVEFNGVVYADTNADGVFNGSDIALPNVSVFGDVNRNGVRDAGEVLVKTDASGAYNLVVPTTTAAVLNVGIVPPTQWTVSAPAAKLYTRFVTPGNEFNGLDFYLTPPAVDNQGGGGANQGGILMGVVFQDQGSTPNGIREASEPGAPGFTVYIDANNNGVVDAGDTVTTTNQNGAYVFTNVAPGQRVVRVVTPSPFQLTTPAAQRYTVQLVGSGTFSKLVFGVKDTATLDYGDLPAIYGATTAAQNGARHKKGVYFLGSTIDGELNGNPTANADGDDTSGFDDEDGIVFDPIVAGSTVRLIATASRNNGYLKGWIDWNSDGDFDDANERLVFSGIGSPSNNVLLSAGANQLFINVPAGVNVANVYARFRYGEQSTQVTPDTPVSNAINTPYGAAQIGEVEDYLLPVAPPAIPAIVGLPADFTGDGRVDGMDFLTWQRHFGATSGAGQAQGSTNGDGDVDKYDLDEWKIDFGSVVAVASLTTEEDYSDAPQTLAVEFQGVSTFTAAADQSFSSALRSTGSSLGLTSVSPVVSNDATARFESRPNWATIAGKLNDVAERLRQRADSLDDRLEEGRDFVVELLHDVADRVDNFDFESVRRDRAFDDLFGSRRRQGLNVEADAAASEETDADDAFAMFADHFEVPRG